MALVLDGTNGITGVPGNISFASGTNGVVFNNSSALTNSTLNDYETGTWTPVDNSGAGLTLSVTSASYTKIGNVVFISAFVTYPSTSNTNAANIGGLPFTSKGSNTYTYIMGRTGINIGNMAAWQVNTSTTNMTAYLGWNSGGAIQNASLTGSYILISGFYYASF